MKGPTLGWCGRAILIVVALSGFYFLVNRQNIFTSFAAMLIGVGALMLAFPAIPHLVCSRPKPPRRL
jgi:hypothetical protein